MIIYGTHFGGKIEKVDEQWIESKFILLMVPLIPMNSMFVTAKDGNGRNGFVISLNGKSVLHGYLRFFTFFISLILWGFAIFAPREIQMGLPVSVLAGLVSLLYAWSYFQAKESKGEVYVERKRLGMIMGLNALPEWLPKNVRVELTENLTNDVQAAFGNLNFTEIAGRNDLTAHQIALVYSCLRYRTARKRVAEKTELEALERITFKFDALIRDNSEANFESLKNDIQSDIKDDLESVE